MTASSTTPDLADASLAAADPRRAEHGKQIETAGKLLGKIKAEMAQAIVGQEQLIDGLLIGMLCNAHVLLEGVPGLAKTATIKALAQCLQAQFQRVQFTPDLLPADVIGTLIYNAATHEYTTKFGPIFTNIFLADEINRCPPKVQSALLEAMAEHQVTIGDKTYPLHEPFLVLATQNPIDQEGTYPLPEAQVDRFMLKVTVGYPTPDQERQIQEYITCGGAKRRLTPVLNTDQVKAMRQLCAKVTLSDALKDYIVRLVVATRDPETHCKPLVGLLRLGGSPRATINLTMAARATAMLRGRTYANPDDVKAVAPSILGHRMMLSYEAEAEDIHADEVVRRLLDAVPVG